MARITQGVRPASGARLRWAETLRAFAQGYYLSHLRRYGAPRDFGKCGAGIGASLTGTVESRRVMGSAMGLKLHNCRGLREGGVPGTKACPERGAAGGDQNGLNLRSATWSNDAEDQRTSGATVCSYAVPCNGLRTVIEDAPCASDEVAVTNRLGRRGGPPPLPVYGGARCATEAGVLPAEFTRKLVQMMESTSTVDTIMSK